MADDLNDLGSIEIWRPTIDLRESPEIGYDNGLVIVEYPGTSNEIKNTSEEKPYSVNFRVSCRKKEEEYTLIEKFYELSGRLERFWFPNIVNMFTLKEFHGSGATYLKSFLNDFEYRGFERIYLQLWDGDLLTHKVISAINDDENDETILNLNGSLDRDLDPSDIECFSLLHLSRLDIDSLDIRFMNNRVSETNIRIIELVQEYSEV